MRRRALRPSFVVTFALGAAAIVSGCDDGVAHGNPPAGVSDSAGCPDEQPANGAPCDLPSSTECFYGTCTAANPGVVAWCHQGMTWNVQSASCSPPIPEAGPDVLDGGADDGGHD